MRISDWSSDVCSSDLPQLEGWIQRDFAVELFKDAGLDFETLKKQARSRDFRPVELEGGTFSAKYDVDSEVITSYNIVGRIEGSQRPTMLRSEEHTSELQSLMRSSYAVFCLKKKKKKTQHSTTYQKNKQRRS